MSPNLCSTSQYLAHNARQQPDAVAVIRDGAKLTYGQFATLLVQYTKALEELSIAPGMLVGIACQNRLTHLLLMLACANIGAATVSLVHAELSTGNPFLRRCDFVLMDPAAEISVEPSRHAVTRSWLAVVEGKTIEPRDWSLLDAPPDSQALARVVRTSGTTGEPKAIALSQGVVHGRIGQIGFDPREGIPSSPKFIAYYDLTVEFVITRLFKKLWMGGTVIFSGPQRFFQDMKKYGANYTTLLVGDAERLASQVPPLFAKPDSFGIATAGAALTPRLRETLLQKFASHVVNTYGSNEVGSVCVMDEQGVGTLLPGVRVAVSDEQGREKPQGEAGRIKVKSQTMFAGYLDDPALAASTLVDGWFHAGDLGRMPSADRLVVLGRADDMLNIGGLKIAPGEMEDKLKALPGIRDAAIVAVAGAVGATPAIAVEIASATDPEQIKAAITKVVGSRFGRFHLILVQSLPRTDNGKVRRRELADWIRRQLATEP